MDDLRLGSMLRAVRIHQGRRQRDVASRARTSDVTVSRIERGRLKTIDVGTVREVAAVLGVQVAFRAWSRDGDLDRLVNARHSALAERTLEAIDHAGGWLVRPEVSFSIFGERGVVDLLAWHGATGTLLVVELKTAIVDVGELLATLGRKRRLALNIATQFEWRPASVSTALVVSESRTNRRRIDAHARTFASVLPDRTRRFGAFLRQPSGLLAAVAFLSDRHPGTTSHEIASVRRVRTRRAA